jgi:hypothetical protein
MILTYKDYNDYLSLCLSLPPFVPRFLHTKTKMILSIYLHISLSLLFSDSLTQRLLITCLLY